MANNIILGETSVGIRAALLEKAGNGNTSYVRKETIVDNGGFETSWYWYDDLLCRMEEKSREFVSRYFSILSLDGVTDPESVKKKVVERDEILSRFNSELIDMKKEMLAVIDPEGKHHCTKFDGVVIAMFAHGTEAMANNVAGEKDFQIEVQDTFASRAKFRHALEGYFGRIILANGMMSPERATFLREQRKLLGKVNAAKRKIKDLQDQLKGLEIAKSANPEAAKYFESAIRSLEKKIGGAKGDQKKAERNLDEFHKANPDGTTYEPTIQEEMNKSKKKEVEAKVAEKVNGMTVKELKEALDAAEVPYPKKATKPELQKLLLNVELSAHDEPEQAAPDPEQQEEKVTEPEQATAEAK